MALRRVQITSIVKPEEGYKSMAIPSTIHSYSVCLEYLRKWFLSRFAPGFFGDNDENFHLSGRHAFDDFRRSLLGGDNVKDELLKSSSATATLSYQFELEYDRDTVDMYPFGLEMYLRRHNTTESPFFTDTNNSMYLAHDFEVLRGQFNFRIKFKTRALQVDMYKYCKIAFRIGATQGEYIDYDQHIPYSLMTQVAKDAGFQVVNGKIIDIVSFLRYLNMNSIAPIMYKFRNINGNDEFFIRIKHVYVHIAIPEIDYDDGEKEGHSTSRYCINFTATVRFPATKCYIYFSKYAHTEIQLKEEVPNTVCFSTIRMIDAPDYNERRWKKIISTEYEDDIVKDDITQIDMTQLLYTGDLGKVIKHTTDVRLSPELFLELKFFNNGEYIPFAMNWQTGVASSSVPLTSTRSFIVVYADMDYVNQQVLTIEKINERGRL